MVHFIFYLVFLLFFLLLFFVIVLFFAGITYSEYVSGISGDVSVKQLLRKPTKAGRDDASPAVRIFTTNKNTRLSTPGTI